MNFALTFLNRESLHACMAKHTARSIIIGRKPRVEGNEFKTAFIKIYQEVKPLTIDDFPETELDFPNIEKVVFSQIPEYYLEGNDLVFDDIQSFEVNAEGVVLYVSVDK